MYQPGDMMSPNTPQNLLFQQQQAQQQQQQQQQQMTALNRGKPTIRENMMVLKGILIF